MIKIFSLVISFLILNATNANGDPKLIEHYRNLRQKDWKRYTQPRRYQPHLIKKENKKPLSDETLTENQREELHAEIKQNMSYFCMKKPFSEKINGETQCLEKANVIYERCLTLSDGIVVRPTLNCVKSKLTTIKAI